MKAVPEFILDYIINSRNWIGITPVIIITGVMPLSVSTGMGQRVKPDFAE